jgi:hypothetical protein
VGHAQARFQPSLLGLHLANGALDAPPRQGHKAEHGNRARVCHFEGGATPNAADGRLPGAD